jgi:hypothetical protein
MAPVFFSNAIFVAQSCYVASFDRRRRLRTVATAMPTKPSSQPAPVLPCVSPTVVHPHPEG